MSRLPDIDPKDYTPEQKRLADEIGRLRRGVARGPFAIWMRIPAAAELAGHLGNKLRLEGRIERRLYELMVLVVARHWTAQFEWFAHEPYAREFGIPAEAIEAIRTGQAPSFARADEQVVHATVSELNRERRLSQASYDRAVETLGVQALIELIAGAGYYVMIAMTLNSFEVPVPGGARPLPEL